MFCGFGAVVLLVLIVHANTLSARRELHEDLRAEVDRAGRELQAARSHLAALEDRIVQRKEEHRGITARAVAVENEISAEITKIAQLEQRGKVRRSQVQALEAELKKLDGQRQKLAAERRAAEARGTRVRRFEGEGNRQYLTGLKLGGKRILILVDVSASMLDETVVNVLRLRNMSKRVRGQAHKWQQVKKTASWLVANLPPQSTLQLVAFNTQGVFFDQASAPVWVKADDTQGVTAILQGLFELVPSGGTSLENGFAKAAKLSPPPDNIVLLTDGLPTQGKVTPNRTTVSAEQRVRYFEAAVKKLPPRVPVNTILFPMEGDPLAAVLFWQLAVDTNGSFLTPTRDWP